MMGAQAIAKVLEPRERGIMPFHAALGQNIGAEKRVGDDARPRPEQDHQQPCCCRRRTVTAGNQQQRGNTDDERENGESRPEDETEFMSESHVINPLEVDDCDEKTAAILS